MKKVASLLALAFAAVALVACGGGDGTTTTSAPTSNEGAAAGGAETQTEGGAAEGAASTLSFEADPGGNLAYTADTATAEAGNVTVKFSNPQALSHDVAIEDSSGETSAKRI